MGGRLQEDIKVLDDKIDKLETFWRREISSSLKFRNLKTKL